MGLMKYDPQKHHRHSIRLKGYDYTQAGPYFITLVACQRACLFGDIVDGVVRLNSIGKIILTEWKRLLHQFPNIREEAFVVMPNHVHGIIIIGANVGATHPSPDEILDSKVSLPDDAPVNVDGSPLQKQPPTRANGPPYGSLGAMIGQFKSRCTKRIWALPGAERIPVWQRNYYEHIIRDKLDYQCIIQYIQENPLRWQEDQLHPSAQMNTDQLEN